MSNVLNKSDFEKLKRLGSINSLVYVKNQLNADKVVLKISLSCKSLKCWYNLKKLTSLKVSFIEILNAVLTEKLAHCFYIPSLLSDVAAFGDCCFFPSIGHSGISSCESLLFLLSACREVALHMCSKWRQFELHPLSINTRA